MAIRVSATPVSAILMSIRRQLSTRLWRVLSRTAPLLSQGRNLVLFGARNGDWYMDNSRFLFEWVVAHEPDIEAVWMTRNRRVHDELRGSRMPVARSDSWRGMLLLLRARLAVISNQILDVAPSTSALPERLRLVILGHGQPVKGYRFTRKGGISSGFAHAIRRIADRAVVAVSTSDFMADIDSASQGIDRDRYAITGFPRNDRLLEVPAELKDNWVRFAGEQSGRRTILYAPTWRREMATEFFPFTDFREEKLLELLQRLDALLLLRPHVQDLRKDPLASFLQRLTASEPRIRLATNDQVTDVNDLLPFVDVLVTDYSSVYHDFLLLDRPMIFVPYDFERFEREDGFVYDYFRFLPGPVASDFDAFCTHLETACTAPSAFAEERALLRRKVHEHHDAKACERIAVLIRQMLASGDHTAVPTTDERDPLIASGEESNP